MSRRWPLVPLGDVLTQVSRAESVDSLKEYRLLGVRLDGQGPFLRETVSGATTAATKLFRVQAGDFIYSRLFAWRGAFGLVGPDLDGCYVSGEFPTFVAAPERLDLRYLLYWFRLPGTLARVSEDCAGSTPLTRNRFNERFFLRLEIPLPPLEEQRRIIGKIEQLSGAIREARDLREQARSAANALVGARAATLFRDSLKNGTVPLESVAVLERGKFSHRPRNDPRFFGGDHPWIQIGEIENAGRFVRQWSQTLNDQGLAISKKFPRGTILISIAATIGAVGILDFDCCVPDSIVGVTPSVDGESEFYYHYLGYLRGHLRDIAPQSAQKNINLRILAQLPVPKLSQEEKRSIVAELDSMEASVATLRSLQTESAADIDAALTAVLSQFFTVT